MFHKTRADLRKWAVVISVALNSEKVSLRELGKEIGVTKDTTALMLKRIDKSLLENRELFKKIIETI